MTSQSSLEQLSLPLINAFSLSNGAETQSQLIFHDSVIEEEWQHMNGNSVPPLTFEQTNQLTFEEVVQPDFGRASQPSYHESSNMFVEQIYQRPNPQQNSQVSLEQEAASLPGLSQATNENYLSNSNSTNNSDGKNCKPCCWG